MILTIRTDSPVARLAFFKPGETSPIAETSPELGRNMARDILSEAEKLLHKAKLTWKDLTGIVAFQGPGSFTGLRIGITFANTVAYAQQIPIVGAEGDEWQRVGLEKLAKGNDERVILPRYGAEARITQPRK